MSKIRLTDGDKWDDPWFAELPIELKCLWQFICDKCDSAGVWKVNKRFAEIYIGTTLDWELAINVFEGRVVPMAGGQKWLIAKFVVFQTSGGLTPACRPHRAIFRIIQEHGLEVTKYLKPGVLPSDFITSKEEKERVVDRVSDRVSDTHNTKTRQDTDHTILEGKGSAEGKPSYFRAAVVACLKELKMSVAADAVDEWLEFLEKNGIKTSDEAVSMITYCVKRGRAQVNNASDVRYCRHVDGWARYWRDEKPRARKESA